MNRHTRCFALALCLGLAHTHSASLAAEQSGAVDAKIAASLDELSALYRHLHAAPELSFQEEKTAARLAAELRAVGFEVTERIGRQGIVGVLRNGDGPVVLVRTDLDALPVLEETGLAYASRAKARDPLGQEVPVMHACGHDMHMAVFAGTAGVLSAMRSAWSGTIVLIGQPAEERGGGARAMLADGLFTRFPKPDYALALHVNSTLPAGTVGYTEGFALANVDSVNITIRGVGGHGAWPHTAKDPIVLAAQTVLALQTVVSREIEPIEPAVLTVGSIHGGTKHNIIPQEVKLQLTLRSYRDEVRHQMIASIQRITRGLAAAAGLPEDRMPLVDVEDEFTPATYNDPALTQRLAAVFRKRFGAERVHTEKPAMGGEDFGEYGRTQEKVPICIFWLGSQTEESLRAAATSGRGLPALHSGRFYPALEPTLRTGIQAMSAAVFELLRRP